MIEYYTDVFTGTPVLTQTLRSPITNGLDGVSGLSIFADTLIAVARSSNSLTAFQRQGPDSPWEYSDRLRQGSGGVGGLAGPMAIADAGSRFYVASLGDGTTRGSVARFDLNFNPPPKPFTVNHSGMSSLNVNLGGGVGFVSVNNAAVPMLTVDTGSGGDAVKVISTTASSDTLINLGNDGDEFELLATGANSTFTVNGGDGPDNFQVSGYSLGNHITVNGSIPDDSSRRHAHSRHCRVIPQRRRQRVDAQRQDGLL